MLQEPTPREMGYYFALAQIGLEMVIPGILGAYLDQRFDTIPWLTIVLGVCGFAGGLFHLVSILNRKERDESSDQNKPS